jgi:hypothetical protein
LEPSAKPMTFYELDQIFYLEKEFKTIYQADYETNQLGANMCHEMSLNIYLESSFFALVGRYPQPSR